MAKQPRIDLSKISPTAIADLKKELNIGDDLMKNILTAITAGVKTPEEFLYFNDVETDKLEEQALSFYRQKNYEKAMQLYLEVINIDRERSTAWRGLGACQQAQDAYLTAIHAYRQAFRLDPDDLISYVALGECWYFSGFHEIGLNTLKEACKKTATKPEYKKSLQYAQAFVAAHPSI